MVSVCFLLIYHAFDGAAWGVGEGAIVINAGVAFAGFPAADYVLYLRVEAGGRGVERAVAVTGGVVWAVQEGEFEHGGGAARFGCANNGAGRDRVSFGNGEVNEVVVVYVPVGVGIRQEVYLVVSSVALRPNAVHNAVDGGDNICIWQNVISKFIELLWPSWTLNCGAILEERLAYARGERKVAGAARAIRAVETEA